MAQNDRTTGLVGNAGMKVPVKAATTAAITLSGEQTIDGIACVADDRVLVKDQATGSENGIYVVDTGTWTRAKDCNGVYDLVSGSMVRVNQGTTNGAGLFAVSTSDPITIGTTSLSFSRLTVNYIIHEPQTASAGQTVFNLGSAYQIAANGLAVYLNGVRQRISDDYSETSTTRVTFTRGLAAGDHLDFFIGNSVGNLTAASASLVAIADASDYFVATTVEGALSELVDAITVDNGDASATLTWGSSTPVQRWNTALTANRTVTLSTSNAKEGAHFTVIRGAGATGNFTLAVGSLVTLRAPGEWCQVRYDAGTSAWIMEEYGFLPTAGQKVVDADVGDANKTLTVGTDGETQRWATTLTADRTATLATTTAWPGARFRITRLETAGGSYSLNVVVAGVRLIRLAPGQSCLVEYTGAAWIVTEFTNLRPGLSSVIRLEDDFLGEEIDGYRWQSLVGTDAEAMQATVLADQQGGVTRLTTGDDAAASMAVNGTQLNSRLNWKAGQGGLVFEAKVAIDAITSVCVFVGFTDQVSALEMPFTLAAGDVLTSNASNAVGMLFDTAADTDNWWLVGVAADVDATKQNAGSAPVAGTSETWRIEVTAAGVASFYRNGTLIGSAMTGAVGTTAALTPVVAAFSRGAASRNVDVDFIHVQAQR